MSETDAVSGVVEAAFEHDYLPRLAEYTTIACLSPAFDPNWSDTGAIAAAAGLLRDFAAGRNLAGLAVETVVLPGLTPVVLLELPATDGSAGTATTLLYGHYDKQPPLGRWREGLDPFQAVREGDRLYGRGTADDGYSLFAMLGALEALAATGRPHGRIVGLIEGSEESGSPHLEAYLDHLASRIGSPGLVICLDSGCATYDRLWVTTSLRGVIGATLCVKVLDEGVHSGHAGGIVPGPFRIARALLSRIEDETTGEILLPALRSEIPSHRRRDIAEVASEFGDVAAGEFPTVPGLILEGDVATRIEAGTWRPALSIIGEDGLPTVGDAGNVLLPQLSLKLSIRLPPNCDAGTAAAALRTVLEDDPPSRATVTVELDTPGQGWDSPESAPWLADALEAASRRRFGASPRSLGLGGSIPFMASLGGRFPGVQFLATGVLGPGSNAHGPNEFLHVPTAKAVACCVADVLAEVP